MEANASNPAEFREIYIILEDYWSRRGSVDAVLEGLDATGVARDSGYEYWRPSWSGETAESDNFPLSLACLPSTTSKHPSHYCLPPGQSVHY